MVAQTEEDEVHAHGYRLAQYQSWDMITGLTHPEMGGHLKNMDIIGVNYYPQNQWFHASGLIDHRHESYRPFSEILREIYQRYNKPILVAETGAEGQDRAPWLRYVIREVIDALQSGVPIEGLCLYPILDYPGWSDDRHCETGLLGFADQQGHREVHEEVADVLREGQCLINKALTDHNNLTVKKSEFLSKFQTGLVSMSDDLSSSKSNELCEPINSVTISRRNH